MGEFLECLGLAELLEIAALLSEKVDNRLLVEHIFGTFKKRIAPLVVFSH